ncbi:nuclear transport factor 2 family protein [Kineosporia sp. J2-2]|uniref:Nuclear transport factor 2 family protein n=1 Tax=Kineosporia corallincola TaxID=2835133 RepID=A0ABS5TGT4_9ACTN|nr:nuclear transport factor 2 family protein [Kineosporia corallincola]MBT0770078.1 nuclear transport factor 2 family protein [Kineosporia corallincola]
MDRTEWIARYARAWRERSPEDVVELFTPDAVYFYSPTAAPRVGREQIAAHWKRSSDTFADLDLRFGEPVREGDRATVEMWATMRDPAWHERRTGRTPAAGEDWMTFPGILVLRFTPEGLCSEHREYYNIVFGEKIAPPPGWGV